MDRLGVPIPDEYFPNLEMCQVLEEFDGPLLVQYIQPQSRETFLYSWVSSKRDPRITRWMVFRVTTRQLASYLKKLTPFLSLIMDSPDGVVYLRDISGDGSIEQTTLIRVSDLPSSYLPDGNAMHDEEDRPESAEEDEAWTVLLDKTWTIKELGTLPRLYEKVYDGIYVFGEKGRRDIDLGDPVPPSAEQISKAIAAEAREFGTEADRLTSTGDGYDIYFFDKSRTSSEKPRFVLVEVDLELSEFCIMVSDRANDEEPYFVNLPISSSPKVVAKTALDLLK